MAGSPRGRVAFPFSAQVDIFGKGQFFRRSSAGLPLIQPKNRMPSKTQSVLLAGIAVGVVSALFNLIPVPIAAACLSCTAYLVAGVLAVWHYTSTHQLTITGGQGAGMGALAAVAAGIVATVLLYVFGALDVIPTMEERMMEQLDQQNLTGEQREQALSFIQSPLVMIGAMLVYLIIYAIVGAIGGAVGASVFKKGRDAFGDETTGVV